MKNSGNPPAYPTTASGASGPAGVPMQGPTPLRGLVNQGQMLAQRMRGDQGMGMPPNGMPSPGQAPQMPPQGPGTGPGGPPGGMQGGSPWQGMQTGQNTGFVPPQMGQPGGGMQRPPMGSYPQGMAGAPQNPQAMAALVAQMRQPQQPNPQTGTLSAQ